MQPSFRLNVQFLALSIFVAMAGCGDSGDTSTPPSSSAGTAGTQSGGSSGSTNQSGTAGTGAVSGTGGSSGSAGTGGIGGTAGTGATGGNGGTGGNSGNGGNGAVSGTNPGGASGNSGTGGGIPCDPTTDPVSQCPDPMNECVVAVCADGVCATSNVADGIPVAAQVMGDCKQVVCDGQGSTHSNVDNNDTPDDGNLCTSDVCDVGNPSHISVAPGLPGQCTVNGLDGVCGDPNTNASGTCVECNVGADCADGVCGANHVCLEAQCGDNTHNGDETDVDCGGPCAPCADTLHCLIASDCASQVCDPSSLTCTAATCFDEVINHGESDNDCGNVCAADGKLCPDNAACVNSNDCESFVCDTTTTHTCLAPTCSDGVVNQDETDVDCGGTICPARCVNSLGCSANSDCQSNLCDTSVAPAVCIACSIDAQCGQSAYCSNGVCTAKHPNGAACVAGNTCTSSFCTDGVCCDTSCNSTCQSCTAALKGAGADGVCGNTAVGGSSKGLCTTSAQTTCGTNGLCDAGGSCQNWSNATQCTTPTCVGNSYSVAKCNGTGSCGAVTNQSCGPYVCKPSGCPSTCSGDGDCVSGLFCAGFLCAPKQANGSFCSGANQCESGNCVDGVCCNSSCFATCYSCNGPSPGTCSPVAKGNTDPPCFGTNACNGFGMCLTASGFSCSFGSQCVSGVCTSGTCQ